MKLVINAGLVVTPQESLPDAVVVAEDGVVLAVGRRGEVAIPAGAQRFDFPEAVLAPGFVDVHVHGGAGWDVMGLSGRKASSGSPSLADMERLLARHGVTSYLATTVTAPVRETVAALERMASEARPGSTSNTAKSRSLAALGMSNHEGAASGEAKPRFLAALGMTSHEVASGGGVKPRSLATLGMTNQGGNEQGQRGPTGVRARAMGIHLEGPFLSRAKCGVHPVKDLLRPSVARLREFWEAADGKIRMMTVAPELSGAEKLIRAAVERGIVVSLGHSDADLEATRRAMRAGARHFTHTFNAMRAMSHREPGIAGAAMVEPGATADIIVDGVHVAPEMVDVFLRARGEDGAVLISDGISATGRGDGRFRLGPFEVEVRGLRCMRKGKLAGSVLTLDVAARNVMSFAGWTLEQAVRLATVNPARVLGISDRKGVIAPGADADFVVLTPQGEVLATFVGGKGTVFTQTASGGRRR